jgi:hypothetical protein
MKPIGFPEQILTDEEIKIHETYFLLDPRLKQSHLAANARIKELEARLQALAEACEAFFTETAADADDLLAVENCVLVPGKTFDKLWDVLKAAKGE